MEPNIYIYNLFIYVGLYVSMIYYLQLSIVYARVCVLHIYDMTVEEDYLESEGELSGRCMGLQEGVTNQF